MRTLIVEDVPVCQKTLDMSLSRFGECDIVNDGVEAVEIVKQALADDRYYDLICLDIMMPNLNGQEALKEIRRLEKEHGIRVGWGAKIIMTTALSDAKSILSAFKECDYYLVKPITKSDIDEMLIKLKLLS